MDYLDLKFALARKGYTLTRVAEELGLFGPQSVQQVLTRKYISARVERRVSEIIGIPLEKLFPDRYQPTKRRGRAHGTNLHKETRDTGRASLETTLRKPRKGLSCL